MALSDFFHPGRAYKAAEREVREGQQRAQQFQLPFYQAGLGQLGNIQGAIGQLLNPTQFLNQLLEGYEESPYAQQLTDVATERGQQAASAAGLMGSSNALQSITQQAGQIAQQDRENYLKNLIGLYTKGTDLASDIYGTGAQFGQNLASGELQTGQQLGALEKGRRDAGASLIGSGIGLIGDLGLNYLTGGFGKGSFGRGAFTPVSYGV